LTPPRERCQRYRHRFEDTAAERAAMLRKQTGQPWRAYLCPVCDGYHLTTQPPRDVLTGRPVKP
jgi:hypothetical protein